MKNRDLFIDLMEEIDVKHLDEHIQKNTDTKRKRIRSYILSAGIYAAACVAVLLLIPVIMNFTAGPAESTNPPETTLSAVLPGAEPLGEDNEAIDERFADTKLYKVLGTAGVGRRDVKYLHVDSHKIVNGDVYYQSDNKIYKNIDDQPVVSEELPVERFAVGNGCIFYTIIPNADVEPVMQQFYCYNMDTKERSSICLETVLYFGFVNNDLVYVTGHSKNLSVYKYDLDSGESESVCDVPVSWRDVSTVHFTGDKILAFLYDSSVERPFAREYDIQRGEWKKICFMSNGYKFTFADAGDGYYYSCEQRRSANESAEDEEIVKRHADGVWYANPDTDGQQKITTKTYEELYFVNGKLVGVNGDEISLVVEDHSAQKYGNTDEGKVFPRPESMTISHGWKSATLMPGDELYEYMYEKMNARVNGGNLTEVSDRERRDDYTYRESGVVRVEFRYYYDSQGAPLYPNIENPDIAYSLIDMLFPITGENTDIVFIDAHNDGPIMNMHDMRCFGTLAENPEIEKKIVEYFE